MVLTLLFPCSVAYGFPDTDCWSWGWDKVMIGGGTLDLQEPLEMT